MVNQVLRLHLFYPEVPLLERGSDPNERRTDEAVAAISPEQIVKLAERPRRGALEEAVASIADSVGLPKCL